MKGDTTDYQLSGRISLETPVTDFSVWSQTHLWWKEYCWLKKILWITTFQLSLFCHCIIQETNWAHFDAFGEEACFFHTTSSVTFKTKHEHNHPNIQQCAVKQGRFNTITDFTNSAEGKSETLFHCRKDREQRETPTWHVHLLNYPLLILQSLSHSRPHLTLLQRPPERQCH